MIAANVQLISNNHDLYERQILICKPVCIENINDAYNPGKRLVEEAK